jgi:hypothetical protein
MSGLTFEQVYAKLEEFNEELKQSYEQLKVVEPLTDEVLLTDFLDFREECLKKVNKKQKKEGLNEIGIV